MKSRRTATFLTALLLLLSTVFSLAVPTKAHAEGGVVLKLHYEREDGKYDGWDVWLWPAGGEGAGYAFEDVAGEKVATMEVPAGTVSIGFIVRTQDWSKDIDKDQFIDIAEVVSGTVHVYVKSGIEGCTKVYGDDVVVGTKLRSAVYDDDQCGIVLSFTGELTKEQAASIEVNGADGPEKTAELTDLGDFKYMLKLFKNLNLSRSYTLKYDGEVFKVNMPIVYSTSKFEEEYTYDGDDLGAK